MSTQFIPSSNSGYQTLQDVPQHGFPPDDYKSSISPPISRENNLFLFHINHLTQSKTGRISLESRSAKLEIAQLLAGGLVTVVNIFGFPVGVLTNPTIKAYIVCNVTWKVWSAFAYVQGSTQELIDMRRKFPLSIPTSVKGHYILKRIAEIGIAICSQLPTFLGAPGALSFGGVTAVIGEAFFRMQSIRLLANNAGKLWHWEIRCGNNRSSEAVSICSHQAFIGAIRQQKENFYTWNQQKRLEFIDKIKTAKEIQDPHKKIEQFIDLMTGVSLNDRVFCYNTYPSPQKLKVWQKVAKIAPLLLCAYPVAGLCFENWQASAIALQWPTWASLLLALTPLSALYLGTKCIRYAGEHFRLMYAFSKEESLFSNLISGGKFFTFKGAVLALCAAGAYGLLESGDCSAYQSFSIPSYLCIPLAFYVFAVSFTACNSFIDYGFEKGLLTTRNDNQRDQILMKEDFDEFLNAVRDLSHKDFAEIIKSVVSQHNWQELDKTCPFSKEGPDHIEDQSAMNLKEVCE